MRVQSSFQVDLGDFKHLAEEAGTIIDECARELGFELIRRALVYLEQEVYTRPNSVVGADRIATVPEPTGALFNAWYMRTYTGELPDGCQSEAEAESAAKAKNPDVVLGQSPPGPARLGYVQVLFAVEHAIYVEMGTILGMPARPYLGRAAQEVQGLVGPFFAERLKEAGFE